VFLYISALFEQIHPSEQNPRRHEHLHTLLISILKIEGVRTSETSVTLPTSKLCKGQRTESTPEVIIIIIIISARNGFLDNKSEIKLSTKFVSSSRCMLFPEWPSSEIPYWRTGRGCLMNSSENELDRFPFQSRDYWYYLHFQIPYALHFSQ
jgi:hypothetical protein